MFEDLLSRVAAELDRASIPYMVIGGLAVLRYGEPRLTRDVDITLGADTDRLTEVAAAADRAGLSRLVDDDGFVERTLVLPCADASGIRVDFIFSFSEYERGAIARAVVVPIGPAQVRFATAEDLIVHKVLAGRPRDLEDVRSILERQTSLALDEVRQHLSDLGCALNEDLVGRLDGLLR